MDKKNIFIFIILLMAFSFTVIAVDTTNYLCCVTYDSCTTNTDVDGPCLNLGVYGEGTSPLVGFSDLTCENIEACDIGCINSSFGVSIDGYRTDQINNDDDNDEFVFVSTFESTPYSGCADNIPDCSMDLLNPINRCLEGECLCGGVLMANTGEFCGIEGVSYDIYKTGAACQDSFLQLDYIYYNITFNIFSTNTDLPLSDAAVIINNVVYTLSSQSFSVNSQGVSDSVGSVTLSLAFVEEIKSFHYIASKSGYTTVYSDYINMADGVYDYSVDISLTSSSVCEDGESKEFVMNDCTYSQSCVFDSASSLYVWSDQYIPDEFDIDCNASAPKEFCDDSFVDFNIGEECVAGCTLGDFDCCGAGEYCDNCQCKTVGIDTCVSNGLVGENEICDPQKYQDQLQKYQDNLISKEDISLAFNSKWITYVDGMICTSLCVAESPKSCGDGEYNVGETCEFDLDINRVIIPGSIVLASGGFPKCGYDDCIQPGEPGECTCEVSVYCGNGILEGAEECDWGSNNQYDLGEGVCNGGLSSCLSSNNQCICETPTCPKNEDISLDVNYSVDSIKLTLDVSACSLSSMEEMKIIYYEANKDSVSLPLIFSAFNEVIIPSSNYLDIVGTDSFSLNFINEASTFNFLSQDGTEDIILKNNSRVCFYVETNYNVSEFTYLPSTYVSEPVTCIDIGDYLCNFYPEQEFCFENTPRKCENGVLTTKSVCSENPKQLCRVINDISMCQNEQDPEICKQSCGGLFGMFSFDLGNSIELYSDGTFYGNVNCITSVLSDPKFMGNCYLDYSSSPVDAFDSCGMVSSCYDYKSEYACGLDTCMASVLDCSWQEIPFSNLGEGVCIPSDSRAQDCDECNKNSMNNQLLGFCSVQTCSVYGDSCYFIGIDPASLGPELRAIAPLGCSDTKEIGCRFLSSMDECISFNNSLPTSNISLDDYNNRLSLSNDVLGVGTCKWVNDSGSTFCIKDADDNNNDDCNEYLANQNWEGYSECFKDNIPPITNIKHNDFMSGEFNLLVSRSDDTYDSNLLKTYWSLVSISESFNKSNMVSSNVVNSSIIFSASNRPSGYYNFFYYSSDPSNNVEVVKNFTFYMDTTAPNITISPVVNYFVSDAFAEENTLDILANLSILTTVFDDPVKKVNCSLKLFSVDQEFIEIYPKLMSINSRWFSYSNPNISIYVSQEYPRLYAGDYLINVSCYDFVGNFAHKTKEITLNNNFMISNFIPNSTLNEEPILLTFDTIYDASCKITNGSGMNYNYNDPLLASISLKEDNFDVSNPTKSHSFNWESVQNKFGSYDEDTYATIKYYVKCVFNEPANEMNNVLVGNRAHYLQFAVDKEAPIIQKSSVDNLFQFDNLNIDNWLVEPRIIFHSIDKNIFDFRGYSWESGAEDITVKIKYKYSIDGSYPIGAPATIRYTCEYPLSSSSDRQVCSELLDDSGSFMLSGFYEVNITTSDFLDNIYSEVFELRVDNELYSFDLDIVGLTSDMITNDVYNLTFTSSKDIDLVKSNLDSNYSIIILSAKVLKNTSYGLEYLDNIYLEFDESSNTFLSSLDMSTFEFAGLNNEQIVFYVSAIDSHGIESESYISGFVADTTPPSKPVLTTLFSNVNEIQYKDVNNDVYPLFFYSGSYYTKEDSLFITGTSDPESIVLFSWNIPFLDNGSYDMNNNVKETKLFNIPLKSDYPFDETSTAIYVEFTEDNIKIGDYIEFVGQKRDTYGKYDKRYEVVNVILNSTMQYKMIELDSPIGMSDISSTSIDVYDVANNANWFGIDLSIPSGCNNLYLWALDENGNTWFKNEYFIVCKDKIAPRIDLENLFPRDNSLNADSNKEISLIVSDNWGIDYPKGIVSTSSNGFGPKLLKNGESLNYELLSLADGLAVSYNTINVMGVFNMSFIGYDYAHNLVNFSWSFIIDDSLPESPVLTFDEEPNFVSEDSDLYFMNVIPSSVTLNFIKVINRTIRSFKVDSVDLLSSPLNTLYSNETLNFNPYINLELNKEYVILVDLAEHTDDAGDSYLPRPYEKRLILDDIPPVVNIDLPIDALIGVDYINEDIFNIVFTVTGESYSPLEANINFNNDASNTPMNPSSDGVVISTCVKISDEIFQCSYPLDISKLPDGASLAYNVDVKDKSGNTGESIAQTLFVDRNLPLVEFNINNSDDVISYTDEFGVYDYLRYPDSYSFNVISSKYLNFSNAEILYVITDDSGAIYKGNIGTEDLLGDVLDNEFSFVFNISKHGNILNPTNNIVGDIEFYFIGKDESGNYFNNLDMNYLGTSSLRFYSKLPQRPTLEPIFNYPDISIKEGVQFVDSLGNDYPLYYYDYIFYTKEKDTLYVSGFADDIGHEISIINGGDGSIMDTFKTSSVEVFDDYSGVVIEDFGGGKKGDTNIILGSNLNLAIFPYEFNIWNDNVCVFFTNHKRTIYGKYNKGYRVVGTALTNDNSNSELILEEPLETDVIGSQIKFMVGERCNLDSNYFELKLNLSDFGNQKINIKLKDKDIFSQISYYSIGVLQKDTTEPLIKNKNPVNDEIIQDPNSPIKFTICDDSPGILGSTNPITGTNKGLATDFTVYLNKNNLISGYVSPIYETDVGFCYNYTSSSNLILGLGTHKVKIHSLDFAHNVQDLEYEFIMDPQSPILNYFGLSHSNNEIYQHINLNYDSYDLLFTKNNTPNIHINFSDVANLSFYDVKLSKIEDPESMYAIEIFQNNYQILNNESLREFSCNKNNLLGNNFFNCSVDVELKTDSIYLISFFVNKTINIGGGEIPIVSSKYKKYFVFDNSLNMSDDDIDYKPVVRSQDVMFTIASKEVFGVIPNLTITNKYGAKESFSLDMSSQEQSYTSLWSVGNYVTELVDFLEEETELASGNYSFELEIRDHAGNSFMYQNWIVIDDLVPTLSLTSLKSLNEYVWEDINEDSSEDYASAYSKQVRFKKPQLIIEGTITEDDQRNFVDTVNLTFEFRKRSDNNLPGDIVEEFIFGLCDDSCNFSVPAVYAGRIDSDAQGCVCKSSGVFNVSIKSDLIPFEENSVVDSYIHIIPYDEARNSKVFRAYLLRDLQPPRAPTFGGITKI